MMVSGYLKWVKKVIGARESVRGFVDEFGPHYVSGWVDWHGDVPPVIGIVCDETFFPAKAEWFPRPDVAVGQRLATPTPGFRFTIPAAVLAAVANRLEPLPLAVRVGSASLLLSKGVRLSLPELPRHVIFFRDELWRFEGGGCHVSAWSTQPFRLELRFHDAAAAPASLKLLANGEPVEAVILRDSEQSPGDSGITFEVELPGFVWEKYKLDVGDGAFAFRFLIGTESFPSSHPLVLSRKQVLDWLSTAIDVDPSDTYTHMLALEHAHFLGARMELGSERWQALRRVAATYKLERYLPKTTDSLLLPGTAVSRQRDPTFWSAVREFDMALPAWKGREDVLFDRVRRAGLAPAVQQEFAEHVAPYFMRIGRFDVIQPHITLERAGELASWPDLFTSSMSLPFFVVSGQVERATEILFALSEKKGWLSTEALAAASRVVAERYRTDPAHEKFVYALISLVDRLGWDYWSRHHDVKLIESLVIWLHEPSRLSSWILRDFQEGLIRNYGLTPEFWRQGEAALPDGFSLFVRLGEAKCHFVVLRDFFARGEFFFQKIPDPVLTALAFFRRSGTFDYPRILRELVVFRLMQKLPVCESLREELFALGSEEIVRLAALPCLSPDMKCADFQAVRSQLMAMQGDIDRASHYELQRQLGLMLRNQAADIDLMGFLADVEVIAAAGNHFLAADILVRQLASEVGRAGAKVETISRALMSELIAGLRSGAAWPYQPLLSALAVLRQLAEVQPLLKPSWQHAEELLTSTYGDARFSGVMDAITQPSQRLMSRSGQDTLVVVYSCRKYIDTRVQAMRESWLRDLDAREIPYVVLVGDGDDTLQGDVLALRVSDRYEDLPAKTLAMIHWVSEHTDFQYLIKIDDDCMLNVDEYFDSLSYRKFHYYGRRIQRTRGGTDRQWHQEKSQGERARHAIDKSPEPSVYADGGGAYSLSRLAMLRVLVQSRSVRGQRLMACSFMEDKLVGDLLALDGITVANEDYYTLVRRRFGQDPVPAAIWDNTFYPGALTPTKFAHLDTADAMVPAHSAITRPDLLPSKIWLTQSVPSVWYNSNQLELLSPPSRVQALRDEGLLVISVVRNEITMLPHFLAHYRKLGARAFVFVDNVSDDGSRAYLLAQPDVVLYSADSEYSFSTYGVAWQQTILAHHAMGKWALLADADEFLVYPGCEKRSMAELAADFEKGGYDAVRVDMVDMYPLGDLAEADLRRQEPFSVACWFDDRPLRSRQLVSGYYSNATNHVSALRHRLMPSAEPDDFTAQKFCLVRYVPWMRFSAGLHNIANARVAPESLVFAHFKYHSGFKEKVEREVLRKQHFAGAKEYRRYLDMLAEAKGGFGADGVSVRYKDGESFVAAARGEPAWSESKA